MPEGLRRKARRPGHAILLTEDRPALEVLESREQGIHGSLGEKKPRRTMILVRMRFRDHCLESTPTAEGHHRRPAGGPGGLQAARCPGSARGSTLTPSTRRSQPGPYGQPRVPVCAACVCAPTRLPVTLLPRTVAGRCRGRPGCRPAARSCRALSWLSGAGAVLGLGLGPRNSLCSGPSMRHRTLGAAPSMRARARTVCRQNLKFCFKKKN